MHIGLDDTDSTKGGCTTHVAALLVEKLTKLSVQFIDYPSLIRLNPNVPWKTRGNGALSLRFIYDDNLENKIKSATVAIWEQNSAIKEKGTDPGLVFLNQREIPRELELFAKKTETEIVTLDEALSLIKKFSAEALGYNSCRGIIGALAAIGETLNCDHTFELIAYRKRENWGTKRRIEEASVFEMDKRLQPYTFNNVDSEKHRVIITPRGPDPILFGIRGESPETVKTAFGMVRIQEPVDRWVVFRSNQGTDAHLKPVIKLSEIAPCSSIIAKGVVSQNPRIVPLRHVIFSVKDESSEVDCAAYEPTGDLRKIARQLIIGDEVEIYGAVRKQKQSPRLTINLEKIRILSLAAKTLMQNPLCSNCGKRLKSMGKNQGFRCEKCGQKFNDSKKEIVHVQRNLKHGLYVASVRSQRHLTKPIRRYSLEKHCNNSQPIIESWHS